MITDALVQSCMYGRALCVGAVLSRDECMNWRLHLRLRAAVQCRAYQHIRLPSSGSCYMCIRSTTGEGPSKVSVAQYLQ